jgi:hypothetical protein
MKQKSYETSFNYGESLKEKMEFIYKNRQNSNSPIVLGYYICVNGKHIEI